jgi:septal ring factor EnvC (AmiA/AmiB activator)
MILTGVQKTRSQLNQIEQSIRNIERTTTETCCKVEKLTSELDEVQKVLEALKWGMSAFTKSLSDLLRPFFNWTSEKMDGDAVSEAV